MDSPDHLKIWIKKGMDNWKGGKKCTRPQIFTHHAQKKKKGGKNPHMKTPTNENKKNITFYMFIDYITLSHLALISCGLMVV